MSKDDKDTKAPQEANQTDEPQGDRQEELPESRKEHGGEGPKVDVDEATADDDPVEQPPAEADDTDPQDGESEDGESEGRDKARKDDEAPEQPPAAEATTTGKHTKLRINRFLRLMRDRGASDLHLSVGRAPNFRVGGRLDPIRYRVLTDNDFHHLIKPMTPKHHWERFVQRGDVDFAYEVEGLARFRVNLFRQMRGPGAVFRMIPNKIMTLKQLGLPRSVRKFVDFTEGLVLVTGPTGSGKSTTLAALVHEMNKQREMHLITIEDPIEFVHDNIKALINQREVGANADSFNHALYGALREDPDAILIGEMRDLETIEMALTAAEAGLLVMATLHTNSAAKTIDRIINVFPEQQKDGVRSILSGVVKGILAQQLVPRKTGGAVAALEVLFGNAALSTLIREGKTHLIDNVITTGQAQGMIGMDNSLKALVTEGIIEGRDALEMALEKDMMRPWLIKNGAIEDETVADVDEDIF